ncbi:hypothetical protein [Absidia glauca]|uniref:Ndc10 domain-containing protein n=1 Tax=Absidia glauca TaxID=4829 RepID=A0A163JZA3_ABSGL|nr:hypothetical protein [Absidia glauca]
MEQHNDERRISHQASKRNDAIHGRLPLQWSILLCCLCRPSIRLCMKLFPAIGEWHDRLAAKELTPDNNVPIQPTVAANAFVQVIMMIRKTFIQDLVLMMELHLRRRIWRHSIFSDPAYFFFKRQVSTIALECSSMLTLICSSSPRLHSLGHDTRLVIPSPVHSFACPI